MLKFSDMRGISFMFLVFSKLHFFQILKQIWLSVEGRYLKLNYLQILPELTFVRIKYVPTRYSTYLYHVRNVKILKFVLDWKINIIMRTKIRKKIVQCLPQRLKSMFLEIFQIELCRKEGRQFFFLKCWF